MGNWLPIEYQVTLQLCTRRNHTRGLASMHSVLQGVWQGKRKVKSRLLLLVLKCCFPRLSSLPGSAPYKCSSLMHSFSSSIFSLLQTFWNVWVHRFCFLVHSWLSNSLCRQLVPTAHPLSVLCCCRFLFAQSCPPLCDPMDCSPPGYSVYGILQTRIPECVAMPFSRGSSQPRDQTRVSYSAGGFFTTEPPGKPLTAVLPSGKTQDIQGKRCRGKEKKSQGYWATDYRQCLPLSLSLCFSVEKFWFSMEGVMSSRNICFICLPKRKTEMLHTKNDKQLPASSYA